MIKSIRVLYVRRCCWHHLHCSSYQTKILLRSELSPTLRYVYSYEHCLRHVSRSFSWSFLWNSALGRRKGKSCEHQTQRFCFLSSFRRTVRDCLDKTPPHAFLAKTNNAWILQHSFILTRIETSWGGPFLSQSNCLTFLLNRNLLCLLDVHVRCQEVSLINSFHPHHINNKRIESNRS
jgi:hypothetical protein